MKLLTKEILDKLPPLGANDDKSAEEIPVIVKFFTPDSNWTWYATNYDPETKTFFGFVRGLDSELGEFTLDELEAVRGALHMKVERDMYFGKHTLAEAMAAPI